MFYYLVFYLKILFEIWPNKPESCTKNTASANDLAGSQAVYNIKNQTQKPTPTMLKQLAAALLVVGEEALDIGGPEGVRVLHERLERRVGREDAGEGILHPASPRLRPRRRLLNRPCRRTPHLQNCRLPLPAAATTDANANANTDAVATGGGSDGA